MSHGLYRSGNLTVQRNAGLRRVEAQLLFSSHVKWTRCLPPGGPDLGRGQECVKIKKRKGRGVAFRSPDAGCLRAVELS